MSINASVKCIRIPGWLDGAAEVGFLVHAGSNPFQRMFGSMPPVQSSTQLQFSDLVCGSCGSYLGTQKLSLTKNPILLKFQSIDLDVLCLENAKFSFQAIYGGWLKVFACVLIYKGFAFCVFKVLRFASSNDVRFAL